MGGGRRATADGAGIHLWRRRPGVDIEGPRLPHLTSLLVIKYIATGPMGRTKVPGVCAAGDSSDLGTMVSAARGAGVAAAINTDLLAQDADAAARVRVTSYQ